MKTAIELISEERKRQVEQKGWTPEHDDGHINSEIAIAAAAYALPTEVFYPDGWYWITERDDIWPWVDSIFKPTPYDRIRELTKAGALIVAEIERLQRIKEA